MQHILKKSHMKRIILLSTISMITGLGAIAGPLSPEQAVLRLNAGTEASPKLKIKAQSNPVLTYTKKTTKGTPALYVFNNGNGSSMILPASDLAVPVLGYTDSGTIDPNNIPDGLQYLLNMYAAQIEAAEEAGLSSSQVSISYPSSWTAIEPLVKSKWDQLSPYNGQTPQNAPTGCVATAMAQVLNYWKFPQKARGTGSASFGEQYLNSRLDEKDIDWANMQDVYGASASSASKEAVAYLMKLCGYSVNMIYRTGSSGAFNEMLPTAFVNNFNYSADVKCFARSQYSPSDWAALVYDQLKNKGPVVYTGDSPSTGHAFVCDGYDGNGNFHFNWGWSGTSDGYYPLDALNPGKQGTGGSNFGGFNFSQSIIGNIVPDRTGTPTIDPELQFSLFGNATAGYGRGYLTFTVSPAYPGCLFNTSHKTVTPVLGFTITSIDGGNYTNSGNLYRLYLNNSVVDGIPALGPSNFIARKLVATVKIPDDLPDGKYKVQMVWKNAGDSEWRNFTISYGCYDYAYLTKEGEEFSVESFSTPRLVIESAEVITPLYYYSEPTIRFTVTNPADIEQTQSIVPIFYCNGTSPYFQGDSQCVSVGPKETKTVEFPYTIKTTEIGQAPTPGVPLIVTMGAYDYNSVIYSSQGTPLSRDGLGIAYYGDFATLEFNYYQPSGYLQTESMTVSDADERSSDLPYTLYDMKGRGTAKVNVQVKALSMYVSSPLTVTVYEYDEETRKRGSEVATVTVDNAFGINSNESGTGTATVDISSLDSDKIYNVVAYYSLNNANVTLGNLLITNPGQATGIATLSSDNGKARYFTLEGMEIANPVPGSICIRMENGKATKVLIKE